MKLSLIAAALLHPFLERMLPLSPHTVSLFLSDTGRQEIVKEVADLPGCDAILLLDGAEAVPPEGLAADDTPLILPRVHNGVALLLGGSEPYRKLFLQYEGRICWQAAGSDEPVFPVPQGDCACLCYLADTALGIPDTGLQARAYAQRHGLDFFEVETDLSLLRRLLSGDWETPDILRIMPGQAVRAGFTRELFG